MQIYLYKYYSNYIANNYINIELDKQKELEDLISKSIKKYGNVYLNFDGGYGYTMKFIELICSFLLEKFGKQYNILNSIKIISNDEPAIQQYVSKLIKQGI